jgi:transposase
MGYLKILALDLGKFNSVCCVMDVPTRQQQFLSLQTTPTTLHEMIVTHLSPEPGQTLLVIEACDAAGWVYDLAVALGVAVIVVNANDARWQWRKVKRKTDRDDALKLAKLALLDQLPAVHMPSPDQRQKRRLILHRRSIVTRRTQSRNAIRSIFSQQGIALVRGNKQWTIGGIKQLQSDARALQDCDIENLWRGRLGVELQLLEALDEQLQQIDAKLEELADEKVKLLRTLKGVGPRTAEAVVLHLNDPHRFKTAEQVAGYAGLVPKLMESGQMSRHGHITHRGPSLLRAMLVEAAWVVWRHHAWAKLFVQKVSRGGKGRRKLAMVALARKVLIILWGMLKSGRPFESPALPLNSAALE